MTYLHHRGEREEVLGVSVDVVDWDEALQAIFDWSGRRESKTVCFCNAHSVVTARRSSELAKSLGDADLVAPDGESVAWMLRSKGHPHQERISGPDLMWKCCRMATASGVELFLYGGSPGTLAALERALLAAFPGISIVGAISPPYRELSAEEDAEIVERINKSGARIVWVGLGCPKQEAWLRAHHGRVNAVMLGVGAAFDFHAGTVKRAPPWMREHGLEWMHRLMQDPRRLASRYVAGNGAFIMAVLRERMFS